MGETEVNSVTFRKAHSGDIKAVAAIYDDIHALEEKGELHIGWQTGVYPVESTAQAALERGDLFVCEAEGKVLAAAIINKIQVDVYADCNWLYKAADENVMVLHTLVVKPSVARRGVGRNFVEFYEQYALSCGCDTLRMDTNERNTTARAMYRKLGYREADIVPCTFNAIPGVQLVLLEKKIG